MSSQKESKVLLFHFVRVFIEEYWLPLVILFFLVVFSMYILIFLSERFLDFLVFILLWIQLEVSYRLWWFEQRRRKPILIFNGISVEDIDIRFYVENLGEETAYGATIVVLVVPRREYEKYKHVLKYKGYFFNRLKYSICKRLGKSSEIYIGRLINIKPGELTYISVEKKEYYSTLSKCLKNPGEDLLFYAICEGIVENLESCSQVIYVDPPSLKNKYTIKVVNLKEEPPGILTKIPNILRDIHLYYKIYKLVKKKT